MEQKMNEEKGIKFDNHKLLWHLVNWDFIEAGVRVLMHGAKKYADDNWKIVSNRRQRYKNALERHTVAYLKGEKIDIGTAEDPGTNESHLACIFCNAMFLFWMDLTGDKE
jgi:hypothetical protein